MEGKKEKREEQSGREKEREKRQGRDGSCFFKRETEKEGCKQEGRSACLSWTVKGVGVARFLLVLCWINILQVTRVNVRS